MEHLFFTKVEKPSQDRRKRGGFPPSGDRKNNTQHGEKLLSQVKNHVAENIDDSQRFRFEPHLVMKVELEKDAILSEANISKLVQRFFDAHILSRLFLTSIFPVKCFGC
ncbi:hypothetical protein VSQ32_18890 [Lachnospiraceae bacterium KK002]